jgi:hypothetical protein
MIRTLALALRSFIFGIAMALLAALSAHADETFPVVHTDPITIHVLDGVSGQPLVHVHVQLLGGYDQNDIDRRIWLEDLLTDDQGEVQLSNQLANLPFLQVRVEKAPLCQSESRSFSVELMRRDGLSAGNRCGIATVGNTPGEFAVFVKGKKAVRGAHAAEAAVRRANEPKAELVPLPAADQQSPRQLNLDDKELPDALRNSSFLDLRLRLASYLR